MIKNRTIQLIYQTIYCTLGVVGAIACLGVFDDIKTIRWDFYVHFTNISNFLCLGVMFAALSQTVKKSENSYVTTASTLKYVSMLGIILTFLVFNILLAKEPGRDPQLNWRIGSICFHVVLPIMYVADWFLFYERGRTKWFYPFVATLFPLLYVIFIFIQAAILNFDTSILLPNSDTPLIYPYFFVNLDKQGIIGVGKWVCILLVVFIFIGFVFLGVDKLFNRSKK